MATRYGGDEFCVVLHDADPGTAVRIAERIRGAVAGHRFLEREGTGLSVSVSVGVACVPLHARDKAQLIELADQAMYRSKRAARNAVYVCTDALQ